MYDGVHKICNNCRIEIEEAFEAVKKYLREHPNSDINTVSEATGVEKKQILEFIKDDRLIADGLSIEAEVKCQRCGKGIKSGKYCESCKSRLTKGLSTESDKTKQKNNRKTPRNMYTKKD
jgi:ferredoxin